MTVSLPGAGARRAGGPVVPSRPGLRRLDKTIEFAALPEFPAVERLASGVRATAAVLAAGLGLAATVAVTFAYPVRVDGQMVIVQRAPIAHGAAARHRQVLVTEEKAATRAVGRLAQVRRGGVRQVLILGVPGDRLTSQAGQILVNGRAVGIPGDLQRPGTLARHYLAVCQRGCPSADLQMVPINTVVGAPL
jgi:hypothetical protein